MMLSTDSADIERVRGNLAAFHRDRFAARKSENFYAEWAGVFSVNVEELLEMVARLDAAAAPVPSGTGWPVP